MIRIAGYHITREVRSTSSSRVFFGVRTRDHLDVVLKLYRDARASGPNSRARAEYETLQRVVSPGVVAPVALESYREHDVLVMERFHGASIRDHIRERGRFEVDAFLQIALSITESLGCVHARRVVHGDLKPGNILIQSTSLETCLIDFGLSRELGQVRRLGPPRSMRGSLNYLAPEQTGRTRHGVDFRSDLYSLGIVFYALLTGTLPFEGKTALSLIHAHIGMTPVSPRDRVPSVPQAISDLVMKLLEKEPDERYQSTYGLARDLQACQSGMRSDGTLDPGIHLGGSDALDRLRFSEHVVGKEAEIEVLETALDRSCAGEVELVWIDGPTGIGKSALCSVLHEHAGGRGAYVGRCKFEQDSTRVPYLGIAGVLASLVEQILVESDDRFHRWRDALAEELGRIGGALLALAPDIGLICDSFPPLLPLEPGQARDRLMLALRRFFYAFQRVDARIVLIFDDVQWADEGSLELIRSLLADSQQQQMLLVLAARREAQSREPQRASLPQLSVLEEMAARRIRVALMSDAEVHRMVSDTLGGEPESTRALAAVIGVKACRNPLQVQRVLEMMWERGALFYVHGEGWKWDLERLASFELTSDSAGWMVEKLQLLPAADRELLIVASVQPGAFDLDALMSVSGGDREALLQSLMGLVQSGVLLPCREGFKFSHDRVREAAQCLMTSERRAQLHFQAGMHLLDKCEDPSVPNRIFVTAEHLRRGHEFVPEDLRVRILSIQLDAGKRALAAGACAQASNFLIAGSELFRPEDWDQRREMGFDLYLSFANTASQLDQFHRVHSILNDLEGRQPGLLEYAQICAQRIRVLSLTQTPEVCARYSLGVLAQLGANWPLRPSKLRARWVCLRLRFVLRGRSSENLFPAPSGHVDEDLIAIFIVLNVAGHILSRIDVRLTLLASCFVLEKFARGGCLRSPAYSLAAAAVAEHALFSSAPRLRRQAELVRDWIERMPDPRFVPGARLQLSAQIDPWILPRRTALAPLCEIAELWREQGFPEGVYYAQFLDVFYRIMAGDPIVGMHQRMSDLAACVESAGHEYVEPEACVMVLKQLIASRPHPESLPGIVADFDAWLEHRPGSSENACRTLMMAVLCVFGAYELALEQSKRISARLFRVLPNVHIADFMLYRGLAAAELALAAGVVRGLRHVIALEDSIRRLRRWARGGPDFLHMLVLLQGKRAELFGRTSRAELLLGRAAELARRQQFVNHAAIASEMRARLLHRQNRVVASEAALREAIEAYETWGVRSKAAELRNSIRSLGSSGTR